MPPKSNTAKPPVFGPTTLFDKVWANHIVSAQTEEQPAVLYIDLHLVHEVTSPQAFTELKSRGLKVRSPERVFATIDHSTPTLPTNADGSHPYANDDNRKQVETLYANAKEYGITLNGWESDRRGVVHVTAPESGRVQPGMTIVCGDSHTATHGAFGALAFGIGTTEVGHVLASQCLLQRKPKSMAINVTGALQDGVTAKDLILAIIAKIGTSGGTGYVLEYRGDAIKTLTMEERMTVCNMSIEGGARAGMIAPDQVTVDWLKANTPLGERDDFDAMASQWLSLKTDDGAAFDKSVTIDASVLTPMVTYGIDPSMAIGVDDMVPANANEDALQYMGFEAGHDVHAQKVSKVFVGSCTNGRLSDLQAVANILKGRKVADGVEMLIVPGSVKTKADAEAIGLDKIFTDAGAQWREAGCSMCLAMNGDIAQAGEVVVSTSNRNFKGRQGPGARTVLASPETAAASAVNGHITDPRTFKEATQ